MPYIEKIALEKARKINSTASIYGTFAEIGAGQEVVNHFFKAGQSSKTVAKSMSAYDMTFSDDIYGKTGRYVSKNRLFKMLDHEYTLLQKRLKKKRGHNTKFFAFADTVATSTVSKSNSSYHHGWMGIRFQSEYNSPFNEIILHVNLLDKTRLQQHEALGVLGVNLIYSAFYGSRNYKNIIKSLFDNFESSRADIDFIKCSGKLFNKLNHQLLNIELIQQKSTEALLFQSKGENILLTDALYDKPILIQQYPIKNQVSYIQQTRSYIRNTKKIKNTPVSILSLPIRSLRNRNISYYLNQYSLVSKKDTNKYILISDFKKLYELKNFIRKATDQYIFIIITIDNLKQIFNTTEDVLSFFSRLCDNKTILMVPPYKYLKTSMYFHYLKKYLISTKRLILLK